MKNVSIYFIVIFSVLISGCEKIIPDLARDNPNDVNNNSNNINPYRELKFEGYEIVCRQEKNSPSFNDFKIVKPGDKIWLRLNYKNESKFSIDNIRLTTSNTSNNVQIISYAGDFVSIRNEGGGYKVDTVRANTQCIAMTTDGNNFKTTPILGATSHHYGICFIVNSTAQAGSIIKFDILVKDSNGNEWQNVIEIPVN